MSNKDIINSYKNELFNKCIYNQIKEKSDILLNDILELYNNDKDSFKNQINNIFVNFKNNVEKICELESKKMNNNLNELINTLKGNNINNDNSYQNLNNQIYNKLSFELNSIKKSYNNINEDLINSKNIINDLLTLINGKPFFNKNKILNEKASSLLIKSDNLINNEKNIENSVSSIEITIIYLIDSDLYNKVDIKNKINLNENHVNQNNVNFSKEILINKEKTISS